MGSWRPILAVWALAAVGWGLVALDCGAGEAPGGEARRLVPGIEAAAVEAIVAGEVSLRRAASGEFRRGSAPADAGTVETLLAALEHTWVRRQLPNQGTSAELGLAEPTARLAVTAGGRSIELRRGASLEGRDLVWVGVGRDAALITAAEADQLFPEPRRLLERRPVRVVADGVTGLEITASEDALLASGDPLRLRLDAGAARLDSGALAGLLDGLRALELRPGNPTGDADPLSIRVSSAKSVEWIEVRGACRGEPDRVAVSTHLGDGCLDAAPLEPLRAAAREPLELVERRLVDPSRRASSAELVRPGRRAVTVDPGGEGREAALEWLAELASAATGELAPVPAAPGEPDATVEITYASGPPDRIEIWRQGAGWWARRQDEPVWLALRGGAEELVSLEPVAFRDRDLVQRDPSEVAAMRAGGEPLPEDLAPALARLDAVRWVAERPAPEHALAAPRARVAVEFHPAPIDTGEPDRYELSIGAQTAGGCFARLASDPAVFVLATPLCEALTAPR